MSGLHIEAGYNSTIEVFDDTIVKTSLHSFAHPSDAEQLGERLSDYADLLAAEPLQTAALRETSVVEGEHGYHLRHSYELVDGPSLARTDERQENVSRTLAQVADMSVIDTMGTLAVPFDAKATNFHVGQNGPALIDMFPILTRNSDGSFPLKAVNTDTKGRGSMFPWAWGTRIGVMTSILSTTIDRGEGALQKARHVATAVDDWCYDALPANLDSRTRDQLRRQIGTHFIPFLLRTAGHKAAAKMGL